MHSLDPRMPASGDRPAFTRPVRASCGRGHPSLSDSGLTRAEMAPALSLWAPRDRGRVPLPESELPRDRSPISASPRVGEGAAGPAAWPPAEWGRGAPLRPCPLRDRPEVSGDRDTLSRVQGAAQGVVTGGYLGQPARGPARKPAARLRRRARAMAWMLDCLFASAFEPRPRRGEWGPASRGAGGLPRELPAAAAPAGRPGAWLAAPPPPFPPAFS